MNMLESNANIMKKLTKTLIQFGSKLWKQIFFSKINVHNMLN